MLYLVYTITHSEQTNKELAHLWRTWNFISGLALTRRVGVCLLAGFLSKLSNCQIGSMIFWDGVRCRRIRHQKVVPESDLLEQGNVRQVRRRSVKMIAVYSRTLFRWNINPWCRASSGLERKCDPLRISPKNKQLFSRPLTSSIDRNFEVIVSH